MTLAQGPTTLKTALILIFPDFLYKHASLVTKEQTFILSLSDFTHNGRWKIRNDYRDDSKGKSHQLIWTKANLEEQIKLFEEGKLAGGYGKAQVDAIRLDFNESIQAIAMSGLTLRQPTQDSMGLRGKRVYQVKMKSNEGKRSYKS